MVGKVKTDGLIGRLGIACVINNNTRVGDYVIFEQLGKTRVGRVSKINLPGTYFNKGQQLGGSYSTYAEAYNKSFTIKEDLIAEEAAKMQRDREAAEAKEARAQAIKAIIQRDREAAEAKAQKDRKAAEVIIRKAKEAEKTRIRIAEASAQKDEERKRKKEIYNQQVAEYRDAVRKAPEYSFTLEGTTKFNRQKYLEKCEFMQSITVYYQDNYKLFMVSSEFEKKPKDEDSYDTTETKCIGYLSESDSNQVYEECLKLCITESNMTFKSGHILEVIEDEVNEILKCKIQFYLTTMRHPKFYA